MRVSFRPCRGRWLFGSRLDVMPGVRLLAGAPAYAFDEHWVAESTEAPDIYGIGDTMQDALRAFESAVRVDQLNRRLRGV
jgi:hypothetical protein